MEKKKKTIKNLQISGGTRIKGGIKRGVRIKHTFTQEDLPMDSNG